MKKLMIYFIFLIISFIGVYLLSFYLSGGNITNNKVEKAKTTVNLSPGINLVNSSMVQLNANVEGIVTEKNNTYFVIIGENNKSLKLYIEPNGITSFVNLSKPQNEVLYTNLSIGDKVKGGINIILSSENVIGRTGERIPGDMIAHRIIITNK